MPQHQVMMLLMKSFWVRLVTLMICSGFLLPALTKQLKMQTNLPEKLWTMPCRITLKTMLLWVMQVCWFRRLGLMTVLKGWKVIGLF